MYGMHEALNQFSVFARQVLHKKYKLMNRFKPNGSVWRVPLCVTQFVNHSTPYDIIGILFINTLLILNKQVDSPILIFTFWGVWDE